jgi:hypothetical protein
MHDLAFSSSFDMRRHYAEVRSRLASPRPLPMIPMMPAPQHVRDWLILGPLPVADDPLPHAGTPPWKRIALEVAAKHRLLLVDLLSVRRNRALVEARHEAMYRMKTETSMSFPEIGRRLGGRDHTTVMHGVRRHMVRVAERRECRG